MVYVGMEKKKKFMLELSVSGKVFLEIEADDTDQAIEKFEKLKLVQIIINSIDNDVDIDVCDVWESKGVK